jgi:hypothetical protein
MKTVPHSKKAILWWALVDPAGKLHEGTITPTKTNCWLEGFWVVSNQQGQDWQHLYWKRWEPSLRSAKKLGYRFIRVKIIPVAQ